MTRTRRGYSVESRMHLSHKHYLEHISEKDHIQNKTNQENNPPEASKLQRTMSDCLQFSDNIAPRLDLHLNFLSMPEYLSQTESSEPSNASH